VASGNDLSEDLKRNGLVFFGQITASVTHELNNVIGIIEQVAGLLDDLVAGIEYGRTIDPEKLKNISDRIATQTDRGTSIIKRLNYFAHTTDEPVRDCDISQLLQNLVDLCQRFANLRRGSLEAELTPDLMVRTNPFALEQVVYLALRMAISRLGKDEVVKITCVKEDPGILVAVYGPAIHAEWPKQAHLELMQKLADIYHISIETHLNDQSSLFKLAFSNFTGEAES